MRSCVLSLPLVLVAAACMANDGLPAQPDVVLRVATDAQRYQTGDTAAVAMVVLPRDQTATVEFRTAQRFDFAAFGGDRQVWRWSAERMFAQVLGEETYHRDDPVLYVITWDLKDNDGEPLPAGRYEVHGELAAHPPLCSPAVTIEILDCSQT